MAMSYLLSRLKSRPVFSRRLLVRRPVLVWMLTIAVLAAIPPFYGLVIGQAEIGWISLGAALAITDLSLLALIVRRAALRSRADVLATFLVFGALIAVVLPVFLPIYLSVFGAGAGAAPIDQLGQASVSMIAPTALLLALPYSAVMGLLASWLGFVEITDPPTAE